MTNTNSIRHSHSYIASLDSIMTCDDSVHYDPPYDPTDKMIDDIFKDQVVESVEGEERQVMDKIMNDENFLQIAKKLNLRESQIYTLKKKLQKKFKPLYDTNDAPTIRLVVLLWLIGRLQKMKRHMYTIWKDEPTLREYRRPSIDAIGNFIEEALVIIAGGDVTFKVTPKENGEGKETNTPAEAVR